MTPSPRGAFNAFDFVFGLKAAFPIEPWQQSGGIGLETCGLGPDLIWTDINSIAHLSDMLPQRLDVAEGYDVELRQPKGVLQIGMLMPVVVGNVGTQLGPLSRADNQQVIFTDEGAPVVEMMIGAMVYCGIVFHIIL